jgi:hypothetical protein
VLAAAVLFTLAAGFNADASAAPITVSSTSDAGPGSLRQAILDAGPGDSIVVPAGTYTLTTGELTIAKSLTITGSGAAGTIIQAGDRSRVLHTGGGPAVNVTITGVTIRAGEVRPRAGTQVAQGGGVLNDDATLTLADDVIRDSVANADGAGSAGAGGRAEGGGVYSGQPGTLHLLNTEILSDSASAVANAGERGGLAAGGGAKIVGAFTIAGSTFETNRADARGGQGPSNAGQSGGESEGGGLDAEPPGAGSQLSTSTLDDNIADASAGPGGATGSALGAGTLIESDLGPLTTTDVTITGNVARASASADGGAVYFAGVGQVLTFVNATLSANITTGSPFNQGGNVYNDNGTIDMQNTIVSAGVADPGFENCNEPVVSLGHNLETRNQCGLNAAGDLIRKDPLLGPLEDNGGPAQTMALAPGSPAIDAAGATGCPATDSRGVLRPAGRACDLGAFELATPAATTGAASAITTGSAVVSGTASNPDLAPASAGFQYGTTTAYGTSTPAQTLNPTTAAAQLSAPLAGLAPGTTYHFRVIVTNATGSVTGTDLTFTTAQETSPAGSPPPVPPQIANLKIAPATLSLRQTAMVSYTDTQAARTTFTLQRALPGRLDGRSCATPTKRNHSRRHCTRWVSAGATLAHNDTPGSDHFPFSARQIARRLAPGRYRLQATPRANGLAGPTLAATLRIVAPTPQKAIAALRLARSS